MYIALLTLFALPPLWLSLTRGVHLLQLESYQLPGYRRALREHLPRLLCAKTVFPLLLYILGGVFYPYLAVIGTALYMLLNPPPKMKKPLVYTNRVRRLIAVSVVLTALLCGAFALLGVQIFSVVCALAVLFEPWLLQVWGGLCAPLEKHISVRYVKDAERILRDHKRLITIGITGSYGKTSTKYFLHKILSVRYNVYMTPGNFNTTMGVTRAVREGLLPMHDIFICEMGARHLGDVDEICRLVRPQIGIITSVGAQHLETFGSVDNVLKGKLELAHSVKDSGVAVINTDSAPLRQALPGLGGNVVACGEGGDFCARDISVSERGLRFTVAAPDGESQVFETRLLGEANVQNLTLAIACAYKLGISMKEMVPAVRALQSVPHRLELKTLGDITVIDDAYNSNPEGARMALDTLCSFGGYRVLVTPGLVELGTRQEEENTALGRYAASRCDMALIVGMHNRSALESGLREGGCTNIAEADTIKAAFDILRALRQDNKCALLLNDLPDNYI